ncbi:MAG: hypothetical protein RLZZ502_482 [Pseudomonadota bacterium]|jgi:succinoglycan biosynthesis protein ExoW
MVSNHPSAAMHPPISVVIPYFQRNEGVLIRALNSIAKQQYATAQIKVVIVDDASPVPAEQEVSRFLAQQSLHIQILHQANAGPNTARNTGLQALDPASEFVAYLDSDDEWEDTHLSRAVSALRKGFNVYFSNLRHLGTEGLPEFERAQRLQVEAHPLIEGLDKSFRAYQGDMMAQILLANTMFIPSMVIDRHFAQEVRFYDGFRSGGGDYMYWLRLCRAGARFCFSTQVEVICGSGINMWYANGWGTDGYLKRLAGESEYRTLALNEYLSDPETKQKVSAQLQSLRSSVLMDCVHRLLRRKPLDWARLKQYHRDFRFRVSDIGVTMKRMLRRQ